MNMRHLLNIITESFVQDDLGEIKYYLRREYWRPTFETFKFELWQHMDDPSIGEYKLYLTKDRKHLAKVEYTNSMNKMFNRTFNDADEFLQHVSEITNDPIDPEAMEHGGNILKAIANKLDKENKSKS